MPENEKKQMAFKLWYGTPDLTALETALTDVTLAGAQRTLANRVLNNGFSNWRNATPLPASDPLHCNGDPDIREITISVGTVTLLQFRDWLDQRAVTTGTRYLAKLSKDMRGRSGALQL